MLRAAIERDRLLELLRRHGLLRLRVDVHPPDVVRQQVLRGPTEGYRNHPQLDRFRATDDPVVAVSWAADSDWLSCAVATDVSATSWM